MAFGQPVRRGRSGRQPSAECARGIVPRQAAPARSRQDRATSVLEARWCMKASCMSRRAGGRRGITLGLLLGAPSLAQAVDAGNDPPGQCMPSGEPRECPDRCPSFETCVISSAGGELELYYRVDGQRFECDGLECNSANRSLADYCCRRGEFAPSQRGGGGGDGCALRPSSSAAAPSGGGMIAGLATSLLALALRRRRAQ